jgi:hypothetical protein
MRADKLEECYYKCFGVSVIDIYLERNLFDMKRIMITDFSSFGFFWAQMEEEFVYLMMII